MQKNKKEREKIQVIKIKNEKGNIIIDPTHKQYNKVILGITLCQSI